MEEIVEVLAFLAEGVRISTLVRVKGHKEDTILDWLKEAARHVEAIEAILMVNHQLKRGQLDAMWCYVDNKGEKKTIPKPMRAIQISLTQVTAAHEDDIATSLRSHRHGQEVGPDLG